MMSVCRTAVLKLTTFSAAPSIKRVATKYSNNNNNTNISNTPDTTNENINYNISVNDKMINTV